MKLGINIVFYSAEMVDHYAKGGNEAIMLQKMSIMLLRSAPKITFLCLLRNAHHYQIMPSSMTKMSFYCYNIDIFQLQISFYSFSWLLYSNISFLCDCFIRVVILCDCSIRISDCSIRVSLLTELCNLQIFPTAKAL